MPKMKTKAGAKKRFKLTGSGKLKSKEIYKNGDRIEAVWYNSNGDVEFTN